MITYKIFLLFRYSFQIPLFPILSTLQLFNVNLLTELISNQLLSFFNRFQYGCFYDCRVAAKVANVWRYVLAVKVAKWKKIMFHHHILVFGKTSVKLKAQVIYWDSVWEFKIMLTCFKENAYETRKRSLFF